MKVSEKLGWAVVALATAMLCGCAAEVGQPTPNEATADGATPSLEACTVGLSYIPNVQFAPFYVAEDEGLFAAHGVQATLRHHGVQEGLFTAIASGQEDFVVAGADEAMQAREQGVDLVAVAAYYRSYPVRVIVPREAGIAKLADLRGKRIGVPGRYGESWFGLLVALKSAGLTESDVSIEEIGYTAQAAIATQKVDAVIGFANNDLVQMRLAGLDVVDLPLTQAGDPPLVGASVLTTKAYLDAHPDIAKAVAEATIEAIARVVDDPDDAVEATQEEVPGLGTDEATQAALATLEATIAVMAPDGQASGKLDPAQFAAMDKFMVGNGLIAKSVDAEHAIADFARA
ncbi:MAG: ABC transporter substrate-binding protein [Propionibacteriaceae bacterium]|jgi:NitT/TauT family transport system substrate-binding protein|nr:ABC transporter substrate-binding protein [Propionibacteriaceae bacterium]